MARPSGELVHLWAERDWEESPSRGALAIDQGRTVAWHTLESLALLLRRHRADDTVAKAIGRLIRADLIVIDDIGMLAVAPDAAEALFRVVDAAYEKRSIALTSNIHPAGFDELMPKTLAAATVDRLLHHAHVLLWTWTLTRIKATTAARSRCSSAPRHSP
jgi:DNA replication protein DnaC